MLNVETRVNTNRNTTHAVDSAVDDYLMDAATAGSNAMQERVAQDATDTGQLLRSHVPPQRLPDGSVVTGFSADYAEHVDRGTRPHWAPIQPLLGWARRVLGDESAAYAVQHKIAREGTMGVRFMRAGRDAISGWMSNHRMSEYVNDRL